jgi:hypothetical protein
VTDKLLFCPSLNKDKNISKFQGGGEGDDFSYIVLSSPVSMGSITTCHLNLPFGNHVIPEEMAEMTEIMQQVPHFFMII